MPKPRDYKEEYRKYHGTKRYKIDRAARNKVRRKAIRDGKVKKGSNHGHRPQRRQSKEQPSQQPALGNAFRKLNGQTATWHCPESKR